MAKNPNNNVILIDKNKRCGLGTSKGNSSMVMYNSSYPYTNKPILDIFPKGLYKKDVAQQIYPKAFFDIGNL